jgi:hypothetical protein
VDSEKKPESDSQEGEETHSVTAGTQSL